MAVREAGRLTVAPRATFLFEASPAIGWGHASRCLALAHAMAPTHEIGFAVNRSALTMLGPQGDRAITEFDDGRPEDGVAALTSGDRAAHQIVVVDHYGLDGSIEARLRARGAEVVVIDDLASRKHDCDVLIDSNPGRKPADYLGLVPATCRLLLGADYALLRPEFRSARLSGSTRETSEGEPLRVLVSMGATDPRDVTRLVLAALSELSLPLQATVVLGTDAPHLAGILRLAGELHYPIEVISNPLSMAAVYAGHDVSIGAPSTGALERACLGLPSLLIETADNQRALGGALHESGAAVLLGRAAELSADVLARRIENAVSTGGWRGSATRAGTSLVDGLGVARAAANLRGDFKSNDGGKLIGRRLGVGDAADTLQWQSSPDARRYSRNPCVPAPEEHRRWVEGRIGARDSVTEIITLDGRPVAMARLDARDRHDEVSILVSPDARGRGIGTASVLYLDAFRGAKPLTAFVHPENAASLALFRTCGYGTGGDKRIELLAPAAERTAASA